LKVRPIVLPSDTNESSDDDDVHDERYQWHIVESAMRKYVYVSNVYVVFKTNFFLTYIGVPQHCSTGKADLLE
jgi:hypothetical protein